MINKSAAVKPRILIIDDEPSIRSILVELLNLEYECTTAESAESALTLIESEKFNLVLSDINMGGLNGLEMIPLIHASSPETVVMMISGGQSIESAIRAMRVGAFDYIQKPFDLRQVETAVERALGHQLLLESKKVYETHLEQLIRQRTAQLDYLSLYDALTGLPNRTLLEDRLRQTFNSAAQTGKTSALFFLSLDNFDKISDTLGHSVGYKLLQKAAERLVSAVPADATVARFEDSKFSVLLPQNGQPDEAVKIAESVIEVLNSPFFVENNELFVSIGIGICLFPNNGENVETILKNAGTALQEAKESGESYRIYTDGLNNRMTRRINLDGKLRKALEREEFEVFYQPKINFDSGRIVGLEALVRWRHPENGLISPLEFIPTAEENGLIIPLGEWILRTACRQIKQLETEGFAPLCLSVNLSARQFQNPNLSETIIEIIRETQFDPNNLELELTESAIMKNTDLAADILRGLKEIGIKISIDDFGTGYSSLAYLKRLPIDVIKIDKSFIREITDSRDDAALVMTIITLARNLRLKVVAEGIETEQQEKLLQLLGCDEWQGYLCSQPLPFEDFKQNLPLVKTSAGEVLTSAAR